MNQTLTRPAYDVPLEQPRSRQQVSLASKLLTRLRDWLNSYRSRYDDRVEHHTFIDANLLDDTMGPEIKRTLRI